jgi:uncharacterized protein YqjF (DUF2071 family)
MDLLQQTQHRPWDLPDAPWVMTQTWEHLLFAHWPVQRKVLRERIPAPLELETFEGEAWVAVTPFLVTGARLRGLPPIPYASEFPEVNVRTYVRHDNKPGVFFFSLDAGHPLAVAGARMLYHLPYYNAHMRVEIHSDPQRLTYLSERTHEGAVPADLRVRYAPQSEAFNAPSGTLDAFLTERYCLYSTDEDGGLYRAEIHHAPWSLQQATASFEKNTMALASEIYLPNKKPLLHYARSQETLVWAPQRLST